MKQLNLLSTVGGQLALDHESYTLLHQSSKASFRSLRQEATLRLIDHAIRFEASPALRKLTNVAFKTSIQVPTHIQHKLTRCLYRGDFKIKTLVDEYSVRIHDHLWRYSTISAIGIAQERAHAP